ncbi:sigma-54-dependent Fis family transcriptional regulator [Seongchinamella unica]|uniref:Sigma-54-dependent Fis family transcriptional regulator n=2 Tax=Seongchinamella unica TaxID=2547392 RepID=A0A4V2ZWU4_9GAMM|nr:sigma-54-dependent Fis family transcriptional regulator [Seongchinamella unica]
MPEFADEAEVTIVESVASHNTEYHSLVARHNPDVVASAGSNAAYLANTLSVPVIGQPVTDTDIIEALAKACRIAGRVHLFTYQPENMPPGRLFLSLPELLDIDLVHHSYSTSGEANERLQLAIAEDDPQVVVGPSYTCHMAEQEGVATILLYSKESARQMLREAIEAGRNRLSFSPVQSASAEHEQFVIRSPLMREVANLAQTYALSSGAVLVEGESGTGKEHITREIHRHSEYRDGPLVAVNCGSIPNELFESEFFGYVDGAFTGSRRGGRRGLVEQANGGVLYLDEVGELPPTQQVKLLRVLQEKRFRPVGGNREIPVDFKLIAATNRDLRDAVSSGRFRDDLYYRLNVFSLKLPPLRERPEDIEAMTQHYLQRYAQQYRLNTDLDLLYQAVAIDFLRYPWPGNVRELQNFVERIVVSRISCPDEELGGEQVQRILPELHQRVTGTDANGGSLRDQEEEAIRSAMQKFAGDKAKVAQYLGISTTTLWRRLRAMTQTGEEKPTKFSSNTQSR